MDAAEDLREWVKRQDDPTQTRITELLVELKELYGDALHDEGDCGFCDELYWAEREVNGEN